MKLELLKQYKLTPEGAKKFYDGSLDIVAVICTQISLNTKEKEEINKRNYRFGSYDRGLNGFLLLCTPKDDKAVIVNRPIDLSNEELDLYIDDSNCDNTLKLYEVNYSPFTKDKSINELLIEENAFLRKIVDNFSKRSD